MFRAVHFNITSIPFIRPSKSVFLLPYTYTHIHTGIERLADERATLQEEKNTEVEVNAALEEKLKGLERDLKQVHDRSRKIN